MFLRSVARRAHEIIELTVLLDQILLAALHLLLIALTVVVRVVLVAHCNFDLLEHRKHILSLHQLGLYVLKNAQNQFVEELPSVLEKLIEERRSHFRISFRQNRSEQTKYPVTCVHLRPHLMLLKMVI